MQTPSAPGRIADVRHVHILGIGGVMMSAIARLLARQGYRVTGSDLAASDYSTALQAEGIAVSIGHRAENVGPEVEALAVSAAVPEDNPELLEARRRGLPVFSRADVLGEVVNQRRGIAVAGTHGKTTTSALIATLLTEGGLDPTFLIGSVVSAYGSNARVGGGEWIVVEADEYARAFLTLQPQVAVVLNLEFDHPDVYADYADYRDTFHRFVAQTRSDGLVLVWADCAECVPLRGASTAAVETFGFFPGADWRILGPGTVERGRRRFDLLTPAGETLRVASPLAGRHNQLNVAAAIAAAAAAGIAPDTAARLVERFRGTARRFELLADAGGIRVIDDYAHHPSEVAATVRAAVELGGRLRVVYEPHQYARTRALIDEYVEVFDGADETLIVDIYAARESDRSGVDGARVAAAAGGAACGVRYAGSADDAGRWLTGSAGENETWLVMGAGDITRLAHELAVWVEARAR
ncbi:MAG: UDP-N-acetylmuramate--L-alanine ligase [Armatimonadetes bacterium]|nr:UDP-N-acetylmuramate--L-alanine ligase [Armatimonadota bacterium]